MNSHEHGGTDRREYRAPVCIGADHPCLAGHFPGYPVVPAVLLLEQVANVLRVWRGERLARVIEAKFVAPLLPDQCAELVLWVVDARLRFEIRHNGALLARGLIEGSA